MALPSFLQPSIETPNGSNGTPPTEIKTIEMHTTGELTRIIYSGYPDLSTQTQAQGYNLLAQRTFAQTHYDHIRKSLILEPRGHREMYGAILIPRTEKTESGEADMGVLFLTHEGYSTMCGHATVALGRMLVDCDDEGIFPGRGKLRIDEKGETGVRLHCPCGVVSITVPTMRRPDGMDWKADPKRQVTYRSVPSFATGLGVKVPIPKSLRWTQDSEGEVEVDISYGGAFYVLVKGRNLCSLDGKNAETVKKAAMKIKAAINASDDLKKKYLKHPEPGKEDLEELYSVIVVLSGAPGAKAEGTGGVETGFCAFGDGQVDRSPTGSGVQARVAAAVAKGERELGDKWTYHSPLSASCGKEGGFIGKAVEYVDVGEGERKMNGMVVEVSGFAKYIGAATWWLEHGDDVGKGFDFEEIGVGNI